MNGMFQAIGHFLHLMLGSRSKSVSAKILHQIIDALPEEGRPHYSEQWLADHNEIECPKLELANALSLAWRMRHCLVVKLITNDSREDNEKPIHHRWKLDPIQIHSYGLQGTRIIDKLPEKYVSLRVGENIYVMSEMSKGASCWVFKDGSTQGLAMRTRIGDGPVSCRVTFTQDVVEALSGEAIEPSSDWIKSIGEKFRPN